ncbi:MAG: helix-turn-helix domain-containing protein [Propionibacteriaceae bacterium]|nr:helix-turn-helix domain-containing protein [Propionibacteriaceae bacterium]
MTATLERDALAVQDALSQQGEQILISVARETAEKIAAWMGAEAQGQSIVTTKGLREVSPSEAASMMGISRVQLHKLLDKGIIPFRKVGSHHRIRVEAIERWLEIEDARQEKAMAELMALQNELGLTE